MAKLKQDIVINLARLLCHYSNATPILLANGPASCSALAAAALLRALIVNAAFAEVEAGFRIIDLLDLVTIRVQLVGNLKEHVINSRVVFSARLIEKSDTVLSGKSLQLLQLYFLLLVQIALVARESNRAVRRCTFSERFNPFCCLLKHGVFPRDIVHDECSCSILIVELIHRLEALAASRIPQLNFHRLLHSGQLDCLLCETCVDGCLRLF